MLKTARSRGPVLTGLKLRRPRQKPLTWIKWCLRRAHNPVPERPASTQKARALIPFGSWWQLCSANSLSQIRDMQGPWLWWLHSWSTVTSESALLIHCIQNVFSAVMCRGFQEVCLFSQSKERLGWRTKQSQVLVNNTKDSFHPHMGLLLSPGTWLVLSF